MFRAVFLLGLIACATDPAEAVSFDAPHSASHLDGPPSHIDAPSSAPRPDAAAGQTAAGKRGIAYDLATGADLAALGPSVSWFYNWTSQPRVAGGGYVPMLWNGDFDDAAIESYLSSHPDIHFLLLLNEPNLTDQANMTPQAAADLWPRYEAVAAATGVALVGPAITWGTMAGFNDPIDWLDAFYAAYRAAHGGRDPRIDALAFHWYDYGLGAELDRLEKYGKPFWVTEMANWHTPKDGAQIDTLAKQMAQMTDMVATCEGRADVVRYAWFTGRLSPDPHFSSLLGADGQLTALGDLYRSLPH